MSNSQLNKLKSAIKNGAKVTLKLSSKVAGDPNDEKNFPHKLSLINTQVPRPGKAFTNGSSANKNLPKSHLHKIGQSGGFSGGGLGSLLKTRLSLMKNVLKQSAKCVLLLTVLKWH